MINTYPVSLDEFKSFFLREAGVEYQPFPSWEKTVWNVDDICLLDNIYYASLVDLNHTKPTEDVIDTPSWKVLSYIYVPDSMYLHGDIVYHNKRYYRALKDTDTIPGKQGFWEWVNPELEFEGARYWKAPIAYNEGDKVVRVVNFKVGVWESQLNDNYTDPAVKTVNEEGVEAWIREEDDTEELDDCILDADITRAMGEAACKYNNRLFPKDKGRLIFLYLTMFFLVYDRQMASNGLNGSSAAGPVIHRTVGKMTVTYMQSTLYKSNPSYEFLSSNEYGKKAFALMSPYLRGGVQLMYGASTGE